MILDTTEIGMFVFDCFLFVRLFVLTWICLQDEVQLQMLFAPPEKKDKIFIFILSCNQHYCKYFLAETIKVC